VEDGKLHFRVNQNDTLMSRLGPESSRAFESFSFPIDENSISGSVAKNRQTLNIADVQKHPLHNKQVDKELDYVTRTMLVVAMVDHKDNVIGVLQLINSMDMDGRVVPFPLESQRVTESLASQAAVSLENARLYQEIQRFVDSFVKYSAKAIDARDPCTAGHSSRVSRYSVDIARAMEKFTPEELREIRFAGLLHDVGKIGVREMVLTKANKLSDDQVRAIRERFGAIRACRGEIREELEDDLAFVLEKNLPGFTSDEEVDRLRSIAAKTYRAPDGEERPYLTEFELENLCVRRGNLTDAERQDIESHVTHSRNILGQIPFPRDLRNVVKYAAEHHERLDGEGYPGGLAAGEIPLQSRILAVADVFDALTASDRPYKKAMPVDKAMAILRDGASRGWWDAEVVECLADLIDQGRIRKRRSED
jgi:HD-GYP domain-containing protein (c-di-GMP phosphodiesterase class II)